MEQNYVNVTYVCGRLVLAQGTMCQMGPRFLTGRGTFDKWRCGLLLNYFRHLLFLAGFVAN